MRSHKSGADDQHVPPASYQPPVIGVPLGAASVKAESPLYGILLVDGKGPDLCAS